MCHLVSSAILTVVLLVENVLLSIVGKRAFMAQYALTAELIVPIFRCTIAGFKPAQATVVDAAGNACRDVRRGIDQCQNRRLVALLREPRQPVVGEGVNRYLVIASKRVASDLISVFIDSNDDVGGFSSR